MKRQGTRFEKARFHIATGPSSLFERVRFKMQGRRTLQWHAGHLQARASERGAPLSELAAFDPEKWELLMAEVRTDTGKFVNSCWATSAAGKRWLVVIGFNDTVETVIASDKQGLSDVIVSAGPLYDEVREVNAALMAADLDTKGLARG